MAAVTVFHKYQVVIPKEYRKKLQLSPGQNVEAIACEGSIEIIRLKPVRKMRGFLKGIDTRVERESDRL